MDIQLIAMDLDGTALLDDHRSFSPRLTAALLEAHRRGIAIAPVTGRQFVLLPPPLLPLQSGQIWRFCATAQRYAAWSMGSCSPLTICARKLCFR